MTEIKLLCGLTSMIMCSIVTRDQWGARPPKHITPLKLPVHYVIIHHTYVPDVCNSSADCVVAMKAIQNFHQDVRQWDDFGYHFAVGGDGNIYEGRGWKAMGAQARSWNNRSIGIVLIGDFTDKNPSNIMQQRAQELVEFGVVNNYIDKDYTLYGHREVGTTECPGNKFYTELTKWPHWQPRLV